MSASGVTISYAASTASEQIAGVDIVKIVSPTLTCVSTNADSDNDSCSSVDLHETDEAFFGTLSGKVETEDEEEEEVEAELWQQRLARRELGRARDLQPRVGASKAALNDTSGVQRWCHVGQRLAIALQNVASDDDDEDQPRVGASKAVLNDKSGAQRWCHVGQRLAVALRKVTGDDDDENCWEAANM